MVVGAFFLSAAPVAAEDSGTVDFARQVRPLLAKSCFPCHGADDAPRKANLRLDRREAATAKRKRGIAIVPGNAAESELIRRIVSTDAEEAMPPAKSGNGRLSPAEV